MVRTELLGVLGIVCAVRAADAGSFGPKGGECPSVLPEWVQRDHMAQVRALNLRMARLKADAQYRAHYEGAVVPTVYRPDALVQPGDDDAAQVMFRRTRTLLDELRSLAPATAAGFESAMVSLQVRLAAGTPEVMPFTVRQRGGERQPVPAHAPSAASQNAGRTARPVEIDLVADLTGDPGEKDAPPTLGRAAAVRPNTANGGPTPGPGHPVSTMDVAPAEPLPIVRTELQEPVLDPAHPRIALALDILALQRRIALANPLLGDADLMLCLRGASVLHNGHIAAQYKNVAGSHGSGLFRLSGHRTDKPILTEILQGATVAAGRLAGQPLDGAARTEAALDPGAFGWPDLRHDGQQVVFAWKEFATCDHGGEDAIAYFNGTGVSQYSRERCFHVFVFDLDSGAPDRLRMLTDGSGNDAHPVYLPNGRIVFLSDRRGGIERCGGPSRATVMHSMNPDGSDQVPLSVFETSEFSPSVDHDGRLLYSRWDYVDRGDCIAHHIWTCYPDGRDPRAPHGNYFMGKFRPDAETEAQPIPGDRRLIAVAAAHHFLGHSGSLIVLDLDQTDDDGMSQIRRFTPDVAFPETPEWGFNTAEPLACPWPLSPNFVLAGSGSGPVLVDAFGNRTLLCPADGASVREVVPLRARPRPPAVPHQTVAGVPKGAAPAAGKDSRTGVFTVMDVYNSLIPWPRDTRIAALRIVQIYPRANTIWMCKPDVGVAPESLVRGVLGTVPVESDGSARFEVPANALVYFQALDETGRAIQTMRSATYLQPGAHVTCLGCHEPKHQAPPVPKRVPLALRRPVRKPQAGPAGSNPVFYPALVQPILDRHCVSCHAECIEGRRKALRMPPDLSPTPDARRGPVYDRQGALTLWTRSYRNLVRFSGRNFGGKPVKYEGRTKPGTFGAIDSQLYPMLADGSHHGVKLSADELQRLAIWMDLNSNFLGHYLFTEEQSMGVLPAMPPTTYFDTSDHPEARMPIVVSDLAAVVDRPPPGQAAAGPVAPAAAPGPVRPRTPTLPELGLDLGE